jgi:hypothetical protein
VLSLAVGLLSGYLGGAVDRVLMSVNDTFIPPYSHSAASMPRRAASGGKRALGGGTKRCREGHGFC